MTKKLFTNIHDEVWRQQYIWVHAKNGKEFLDMLETKVPNIRTISGEDGDGDTDGETMVIEIDGVKVICFWFNTEEPATIAHELLHCVFETMRNRDITLSEDSEESFCYLLSFLYSKVLVELKPKAKKAIDKPKKSVIIKK